MTCRKVYDITEEEIALLNKRRAMKNAAPIAVIPESNLPLSAETMRVAKLVLQFVSKFAISESQYFQPCACMGPYGDERVFCPCQLKRIEETLQQEYDN